jgi:DNA-binding LacI/PurR family transcriptional regulator
VRRLPTVSDVAEAANVSRQTVSNVLNTPDIVRPETRERVVEAIRRLGYRPHASARRLRTRVSATIGVRLDPGTDGMSGALLDRFLHSLVERADRAGLRVLLYTAADEDAEIAAFERLLDGADVDAFVLTSTHHGDRRIPWLIGHDVRFVTFGRPWGEHDMEDRAHRWVDVDGRSGVQEATASLLAQGLRRIAFLGWPVGSGTGDDRRAGWREAMAAAGLTAGELDALDLAVEEDPRDLGAGGRAVEGIRPEAVVSASDSLALGARLALGPEVPVIGYDDTPVSRALGFASVAQPLDGVAEAVLELLGSDEGPHHRLLAPALALR